AVSIAAGPPTESSPDDSHSAAVPLASRPLCPPGSLAPKPFAAPARLWPRDVLGHPRRRIFQYPRRRNLPGGRRTPERRSRSLFTECRRPCDPARSALLGRPAALAPARGGRFSIARQLSRRARHVALVGSRRR